MHNKSIIKIQYFTGSVLLAIVILLCCLPYNDAFAHGGSSTESAAAAAGCLDVAGVPQVEFNPLPTIPFPVTAHEHTCVAKKQATNVIIPLTIKGISITCTIKANRMSANVVECMKAILVIVVDVFVTSVAGTIGKIISGVCSIAIIFLGIKISLGAVNLRRDTMLLLIKLLLVIAFSSNPVLIKEWYVNIIDASESLMSVVVSALQDVEAKDATGASINIGKTSAGVPSTNDVCAISSTVAGTVAVNAFEQLDCIIVKFLGIGGMGDLATALPTSLGIGSIIAALIFTGPIGLTVTYAVIAMFTTIVWAAIRCITLYITSIIAIAFLMSLLPIMIPLILFKDTVEIFRKWTHFILVYAIQPVVLVAFLVMTLNVINPLADNITMVYEKVIASINDSKATTCVPFLEIEKYTIDPTSSTYKKAVMEAKKAGKPVGTKESFWSTVASGVVKIAKGAVSVVVAFTKKSYIALKNKVFSAINDILCYSYVNIPMEDLKVYMGSIFSSLILLVLMISFLKTLPENLDRLVGKGAITSIVGMNTGAADAVSGGVNKAAASVSKLVRRR